MYFLRSRTKKDCIQEPSYLDMSSGNKTPDRNMKITLTRLSILENHVNHDKTFSVKNDGKIEVKGKVDDGSNWKIFYALIVTALIITMTIFCFKVECLDFGRGLAKRTLVFPPKNLNPFLNNLNLFVGNAVHTLKNKWYGQMKSNAPPKVKENQKRKKWKRKSEVCYNDLGDLVLNHMPDLKVADVYKAPRELSFIEEQCRLTRKEPKIADNFHVSLNSTLKSFDIDSIPDFASFARGGRILSTSNTEPYVEYKVRAGIFQYIFGIEYFNIDHLPICGLSPRLCQYFVAGPSSVLQPWKKPGDCWSFKGSTGRLQIELSDRIYINAVSLEHIPSKLASPAGVRSAPKVFSVIGIDDSEGYRFTYRNYLGTYEYRLVEPNVQTFSLPKDSTSRPYKIIEFVVESNHGNENYTCVYRLRVHGHKEKFF